MLEQAIEKLTEAMNRNSDLIEKFAGGKAASTTTKTAETATATTATAEPVKNKGGRPPKITVEAIRTAYGDYLNSGDPDTRDDRLAKIKGVAGLYGVKAVSEVDASKFAEVMAHLETLKAGGTPAAAGDEGI